MSVIFKLTTIILAVSIVSLNLHFSFTKRKANIPAVANFTDTTIKKFKRNGFQYIDLRIKNKIISRNIYLGDKLFYKYPITREYVGKGTIRLLSENNFLTQGITDTVVFIDYSLPPMNMSAYFRGGQMRRLSDSSYQVKSNSKIGTNAVFVIMASDNHDEIKNRVGFVVDSLSLLVK